MKRVNWHIPEAAGANLWPNVSSTRDELRSQVSDHVADLSDVSSLVGFRQSAHNHVRVANCLNLTRKSARNVRKSQLATHQHVPRVYLPFVIMVNADDSANV